MPPSFFIPVVRIRSFLLLSSSALSPSALSLSLSRREDHTPPPSFADSAPLTESSPPPLLLSPVNSPSSVLSSPASSLLIPPIPTVNQTPSYYGCVKNFAADRLLPEFDFKPTVAPRLASPLRCPSSTRENLTVLREMRIEEILSFAPSNQLILSPIVLLPNSTRC